jgi:DNA-binding transcriptional LysR family regulator
MPAKEPVYRCFQKGLVKRKVDWFTGIEVSSLDLVETYVANGYGIGLTVAVPKARHHPQVRELPLAGFDTIDFGVMWHGKPTPVMEVCVQHLKQAARALFA